MKYLLLILLGFFIGQYFFKTFNNCSSIGIFTNKGLEWGYQCYSDNTKYLIDKNLSEKDILE